MRPFLIETKEQIKHGSARAERKIQPMGKRTGQRHSHMEPAVPGAAAVGVFARRPLPVMKVRQKITFTRMPFSKAPDVEGYK